MPALFHHQNPLPAAHHHSIFELDELDAYIALQTFSSDRLLPTQRDAKGSVRRSRYALRATDTFTCDDFRMYEYKVRRCMRGRSHDWTDCPFAHPGEKARRRDPRKFHYSGSPCPEFRKGSCRRGDVCEFAHGVFECYLHPARYRTQACKDGRQCRRRVCFFAHTLQELRHVAVPIEDSIAESDLMVDSDTHEMRLSSRTVFLEDGSSAVVLEDSFVVDAGLMDDSSSHSAYADVGNLCEALSVLTLPSQDVVSSSDVVSTLGFPKEVGLPSKMVPMIHSASPNASGMAQRKSSASFVMGAMFQNNSLASTPAVMLPATFDACLYTPYLGGLSSPKSHATLHPSYPDKSSLQEAAMLNAMLMSGGFDGGGESPLSARSEEFSDMVQCGGYAGDATMRRGHLDAGFGSGEYVLNEVEKVSFQLAALGKEIYESSSYKGYGSYVLPSPTSTLAGPLCSSPLSSPPLSPQSTQNSDTTNVFFTRGGDLPRDNTSYKGDVFIQNRRHVKEMGINTTFMDQQYLHAHHHSRQYKWSPLWNSDNTDECNIVQHTFNDVPYNVCSVIRGESPAENAMPDLGWVNELVM